MSEGVSEQKRSDERSERITNAQKEKDPRRVAAGKKLGAISKMAKESKRAEREAAQRSEQSDGESDRREPSVSESEAEEGVTASNDVEDNKGQVIKIIITQLTRFSLFFINLYFA